MKLKSIMLFGLLLNLGSVLADKDKKGIETPNVPLIPQTLQTVKFDVSLPLRMMTPKPIVGSDKRGALMADPGPTSNDNGNKPFAADALLQSFGGTLPGPIKQIDFHALSNLSGVSPPDPAGDVGPNHYVAMTNLSFHVLDKAGTSLFGPAANNTLWSGFGGACENDNSGDPIVLYDQISDRWLLSQFTSPGGTQFFNCIALSTSPDPTGTYFRWAILNADGGTNLFPDYPKYGIWDDGFYISTRDFNGGAYAGVGVYAIDRDDLVAGNPNPTTIYFFVDRATDPWRVGDGLLPADIDGSIMPPLGSPQYFVGSMDNGGPYGAAADALSIWEFDADFVTPGNSTFTLTTVLPISEYDTQFPCGGSRNCIPQAGTANLVDIQSYRQRPLHRLAYRNFGSHESLVTNQSVEASAGIGGIRWWEIRSPGSTPVLHQEGTYGPGDTDGIHRWMGSIAMDAEGNMGLAYSASSSTINPSIRFTGRLASDTLGLMPRSEGVIIDGTGSQTTNSRWGDYTSLNVDPIDDCTFWHVNEYFDADGGNWQIRVGSFKFNECGDPGFFLSADTIEHNICTGDNVDYAITVGSISGHNATVTFTTSGVPATSTVTVSPNPVASLPGATTVSVTNTGAVATGLHVINLLGTSPGVADKSLDLSLNVFDTAPDAPNLISPVNLEINVDAQPSLNWSATDAIDYTVEVATDAGFTSIVFTGTTTGLTIVPTTALNTSTTYYWRVLSNNSCGDSVHSTVFSFTTIPAPGDCPSGVSTFTVETYDFESGDQGWTHSSLAGTDTWALGSGNPHGGAQAWHADDIAAVSDQVLVSPTITLPIGVAPLTLQFWNRQELEDRNTGGCWDAGILEISTDAGATFTQIVGAELLTDPYDGAIQTNFSNPLGGIDGWCGDPQEYLNSIVDLDAYAGQDVSFRFRLGTDSSVNHPGWDIDDVSVKGCGMPLPDLIFMDGFE